MKATSICSFRSNSRSFPTEPFFQSHGYQWIGFSKRTNGLRDQWMKGTRGHNPYADPALLAPRRAPSCFKGVIELGEDSARIDKEGAPGIGQLNTACSSVEQLHIEFALHRLDALTERRLLHAKSLGGARNVSFLGDSDEIPAVPQLH